MNIKFYKYTKIKTLYQLLYHLLAENYDSIRRYSDYFKIT